MLNYNEDNPTCINLLKKSGQTVSGKNSIKALSTMTGAQSQMADKLALFNGCVLPNESIKTLNISVTDNRCILPNIQNDYNLVYTSDGILSINPEVQENQIKKGEGKGVFDSHNWFLTPDETIGFVNKRISTPIPMLTK